MSNFLRDYEAEMQKYTDAPEIFHRATSTGILGALLSTHRNRCQMYGGTDFRWTNLWVVLVGDSGASRKSTCVHMAAHVLKLTEDGAELRSPDDGSPEGMARDLIQREQMQTGNAANVLVASELTAFLMSLTKEYMRGAKYMMVDWYDVPAMYKRTLSKEEYVVPLPRVSIVGGIALALLPSVTTSEDWLGGLMNRCLLVYGKKTRHLREPITPKKSVYEKLALQADETLKVWRKTRITEQKKDPKNVFLFGYDKAALKLKQNIEDSIPSVVDKVQESLTTRADLMFNKMAAIEQISMNPTSTVITRRAVEEASVLYLHWRKHAPELMELAYARSNADLEGDRLPRRMLRILKDCGAEGLVDKKLMENTILDADKFMKAFGSLEMAGLAVQEAHPETGVVTMRATSFAE